MEELVRLYGPDGGRYRDGPDVFFAALASHSPRDLAEVVLLDGQGRFRVLDSGDLTLRLLAVADPAIYGPPLTDYLRRFCSER